MAYSKEIKAVAIKMMLPPNSKPLSHIYEQTNIPITTLTKWREKQAPVVALPLQWGLVQLLKCEQNMSKLCTRYLEMSKLRSLRSLRNGVWYNE